jgi:uncharacterized RDD family membrane protein YckC
MSARVEQGKFLEKGEAFDYEYEDEYEEEYEDDSTDISAPFALRCGAMMIDYILPAAIIVIFTLLARSFGGAATRLADSGFNTIGQITALVVTLLNFFVLAWLRGQTIGKWATGIKIVKADGNAVSILTIILRHLIGYPISILLLFTGFLLAAVTKDNRALHDFIAGTVVIKGNGVGRAF